MFKRRGAGGGREGDIGLADVAVAVLGPVAFLWIVFQGFAAVNSERGCEGLDDVAVSERAEQLKTWHAGQLRELERLDEDLRVSCGAGRPSLAPATSRDEIVPDMLRNVCESDRSKVLGRAGLQSDSLARLAAEREARTATLAACTKANGGCQTLSTPAERQRRANDLKSWYEERRKRLTATEAALGQECPQFKAGEPNSRPSVLPIPPVLADLCGPDRAAVVAAAGIGRGDIDRQEQRIDEAQSAHLACAGPTPTLTGCRTDHELRAEERERLKAELVAWYRELRDRTLADERLLNEKQCLEARAPATYANVVEPLRRQKVCPAADASLIARAGLDASEIDRVFAIRSRLDARLRGCVGGIDPSNGSEAPTKIERSIRFIVCSTQFTVDDKSQVPMPDRDVRERFEKVARDVLKDLDSATRPYNRIEVRGHTDATPILGGCPVPLTHVRTNAGLSALRALQFNEELLRAIERLALTEASAAASARRMLARLDARFKEIEKRAETDTAAQQILTRIKPHREGATPLRLYAIGVGSDEPAYPTAEYPECKSETDVRKRLECKYRFDRRIEFRFVRETERN
jgi:flagellar motor protein MotB